MTVEAKRPLRVGLNFIFLHAAAGGVGRYARELPGALLAVEPDTEIHVFVSRDAPLDLHEEPWSSAVRWVHCPVGALSPRAHLLFEFGALPPLALARRLDVLHSLANVGPAIAPGLASVLTLLDVIWMRPPEDWGGSLSGQRSLRRIVEHDMRYVDQVFAISQAGAREIESSLHVPAERIHVTPLGVRAPTAVPASEDAVRAELSLGSSRVVLCVAQKHPYKNLHRLVRALPQLDEDVVLVLPGFATAHEQELRELAQELGVAERVRLPPWLSDSILAGLYALSSAFVLPSLVEGFGLPVLEAMLRDVPVACSNSSSLPEVAGDAALLFDPERQDEVTAAIRRLLDDRVLAARLVLAARERAASFTWERTAAASLAGYRRAIARRRRLLRGGLRGASR
ncbi:MAG TPA: glycosyltransferase family 1 protein [Solirubrobacteraceae bacterium]